MSLEHRSYEAGTLEVRDAEQRILAGDVVPYGTEIRVGGYTESFAPGAFDGVEPAGIPLLVAHQHAALPVGRTTSLTDTPAALVGEWRVSDTRDGDEVLSLARDGVPLGLSVGFQPVEDKWNSDKTKVVRVRAQLGEISVVGLPAYRDARVTSVRADDETTSTHPRIAVARLVIR
jgi:uncharacterized protein